MGISCQQNGHWAAINHLSGRGLVQPIKQLSSAAGRCAGRGCALIGQIANDGINKYHAIRRFAKNEQSAVSCSCITHRKGTKKFIRS